MDGSQITVAEVAKIALNMETKGMHFYDWAAKKFADQSVKQIFIRLSEEEKEHVRIFEKLLELPNMDLPLEYKTSRFLSLLGSGNDIFPHHSKMNEENIKSPAEALAVGIQAEKDAILFYQELFNKAEAVEVRSALSKLLEEEKMHLLELRDYMDEIESIRH